MTSARFRRCQRIRGDIQFERIRKQGAAAGDGVLFVRALANGRGLSRLGLAIGRSAGPAVVRSRVRRLIREAFRTSGPELPGGLDLLVAARAGAAGAGLEQVRRSLVALAGRVAAEIGRRAPKEDGPGPGGCKVK
jgi:ribonuclease P protein component